MRVFGIEVMEFMRDVRRFCEGMGRDLQGV